jgi:ABC-type branched-subunit amino acid transport system ATPase component
LGTGAIIFSWQKTQHTKSPNGQVVPMTVVLETNEVTKRFGGLVAVNAVSMRVKQGEIVGLIGPNGAGKTTLLNAIAGLNPPTSGTVRMFDENTTGLPPEKMCRRGLSRTFQIPRPKTIRHYRPLPGVAGFCGIPFG